MRQMWFGPSSVVSPREFKLVLGRHAPQFLGYSQHDSHELCNFVVDGARSHATRPRSSCRPTPPAHSAALARDTPTDPHRRTPAALHEDVNRVRKKPYVENFEDRAGEPSGGCAMGGGWECECVSNRRAASRTGRSPSRCCSGTARERTRRCRTWSRASSSRRPCHNTLSHPLSHPRTTSHILLTSSSRPLPPLPPPRTLSLLLLQVICPVCEKVICRRIALSDPRPAYSQQWV